MQENIIHEFREWRCKLQRLCLLYRWSLSGRRSEIWNFKTRTVLRSIWRGVARRSRQGFLNTILEVLWKIQHLIIYQWYLRSPWSIVLDSSHRVPYWFCIHDFHETLWWTLSVLQYSWFDWWNRLWRLDGLLNLVRHGPSSPTLPVLSILSIYYLGNRSSAFMLHPL
jgi:hypothetical protein